MPHAIALALRERIVALHQQGIPLTHIAQQLNLPYRTVCACWQRFCKLGEEALHPHYERCGPQAAFFEPAILQAALQHKQIHPTWGAGLIRLQLQQTFPKQPLPSEATLQRWFRQAGLQPPRSKRPPVQRTRAQTPHEVWELDAKERLRLLDGTGTCVMSVTDEASGALVGTEVFPPVLLVPGNSRRGTSPAP